MHRVLRVSGNPIADHDCDGIRSQEGIRKRLYLLGSRSACVCHSQCFPLLDAACG